MWQETTYFILALTVGVSYFVWEEWGNSEHDEEEESQLRPPL